jgi:DNA-binding transcriptional ArsR family regulator
MTKAEEPIWAIAQEVSMATSEERLKILKMLEEGKLTSEEAAKLLAALSKSAPDSTVRGDEARWLRVRVSDLDSGKPQVNINLPLGLVNAGLRMGARFVPEMEGLEMSELVEALRQGYTGKIIDVVDEEERQHVEIYVE